MRPGDLLDTALGVIASLILFALMLLTFVDVVLRDAFDAPLRGAFELTELMLVVLIFAGLPLVSRKDEHVTIDVLDSLLPSGIRLALRRLVHFFVALVLSGMTWLLWRKAGKIAEYGDTTAQLRVEYWPFVYFMTVLVAITAAIHFYKVFRPGAGSGAGTA